MAEPSDPTPRRQGGTAQPGQGRSRSARRRRRSSSAQGAAGTRSDQRTGAPKQQASTRTPQQRTTGAASKRQAPRGSKQPSRNAPPVRRRSEAGRTRTQQPVPARNVDQPSPSAHTAVDLEIRRALQSNQRRIRVLMAIVGLLPAVSVGALVGVIGGGILAIVGFGAVAFAEAVVLRSRSGSFLPGLDRTMLSEANAPMLFNLLDGLCATMGTAKPVVAVLDDPIVNACTLNGPHGQATLVVTSGLLERLDLIALEGVVAHELAHIKRYDAVVNTLVLRSIVPVATVLSSSALVHRALGRGREYRADQAAAMAVRYPPGLCAALDAMVANPEPRADSYFASRAFNLVRWMWIDPLVPGQPAGELDAVALRRDALAEW